MFTKKQPKLTGLGLTVFTIIFVMVSSLSLPANASPMADTFQQGTTNEGEIIAGRGYTEGSRAPVELLDSPPELTREQQAMLEAATERTSKLRMPPLEVDPATAHLVPQPSVPETLPGPEAVLSGDTDESPTPQASTDFVFFRNVDIRNTASGLYTSSTNEPSADSRGDAVFMTGNWYASYSTDRGQFFKHVSPFTTFPSIDDGFCCDQVVIYDESRDLLFWLLQYSEDGTDNHQRLAMIHGSDLDAGMSGADWIYWDFSPASYGLPASGRWLDYPKMSLSNNNLYINTNVYDMSDDFTEAAVMSIDLDDLDDEGGIAWGYFTSDHFGLMPTDGATDTMYWGSHHSLSQVRIFSWPEGTGNISWSDVTIASWVDNTHDCPTPDGNDPCEFGDGRMLAGWVSGGVIGFMWNADEDSISDYPYVNAARFNQSSKALINQPIIFNNSFAWLYPAISVNARGDLAGPVFTAGGGNYPKLYVLISDDVNGDTWESHWVRSSTDGPSRDRWGDYVASRPHEAYPNTWTSTGFTLQGGSGNANAHPQWVWYGRQRDAPPATPSNDDFASSLYIYPSQGVSQSTVQATTAVDDPITSCGSTSVPRQSHSVWYRYIPVTTGLYAIDTEGSSYDTVLEVWTGTRGALTSVKCDDDGGSGYTSKVDVTLYAGTTYYIEVMRYGSATAGTLDLNFSYTNDHFNHATTFSSTTFTDTMTTSGATVAGDDPYLSAACGISGQGKVTVWYKYTPGTNTAISLDTFNTNYDTFIAIWTGSQGSLSPVVCNDDYGGRRQSQVAFRAQAGTTYYIEIGQP